jgi:putative sigma-54 modulation protein
MQVNINSVHFKADKKLEDFIREKVQKVAKFHEGIIGGEVSLKVKNTDKPENKVVEIRLKVKGNDLISSKESKTFEAATDLAIDALRNQMKKIRKNSNRVDEDEIDFLEIEQEIDEDIEDELFD